ncbi:unnamed protein product [Medioppia subpectinata]|uniref:Uncharacterized protein n=1 Tax=Medioppia subpectinata TaxID=1979941 RepID=A0A7R9LVA5_9ACAR|nr:unnamed protein product [Medioppia subpectinata]CAG2122073.1 unnamed protein product [Medioppia subpectinata]
MLLNWALKRFPFTLTVKTPIISHSPMTSKLTPVLTTTKKSRSIAAKCPKLKLKLKVM